MSHKIIVEKGNLRFSAAHFITFMGKCERLHGHNYALSVELAGELTDDGYVFDFVELKSVLRGICDSLDHRFLIPLQNEHLEVKAGEEEWEVHFGERRYVFPARDVLPLPVDNITAERLAEYVCDQAVERLQGTANLSSITVGVEEAPGQTAYYNVKLKRETSNVKRQKS
jgi:6-pyruvoyl tetrahydropterin synthase/QueD family protein